MTTTETQTPTTSAPAACSTVRFNPRADAELERVYGSETTTAGRIRILDEILGGQSNFYGFGGNGEVTEDQKLGCLEYEYLENLGLIDLSNDQSSNPRKPEAVGD